jgi:aryl-alcohol dehydrogenase-like predicted oxidoreductase
MEDSLKTKLSDKGKRGRILKLIARERGVSRAQIALAWVLSKSEITAPIIGATRLQHLDDAVAALTIRLTAAQIRTLEINYIPHPVVGFS